MPFSCHKVFRGLRSTCAPILTVVGFSLILTYILILYQPTRGPGIKQRMGWQSWEVVDVMPSSNSSNPSSPSDKGVDWWNVTTPDESIDSSSLPLDVWSPLLPHDTGRTYYLLRLYGLKSKSLVPNQSPKLPLLGVLSTRRWKSNSVHPIPQVGKTQLEDGGFVLLAI
jgi:hypothetical protein